MTKRLNTSWILTAAPLWILAGILLCAPSIRAQDSPEHHHSMENRFLFVVDTSSAMRSRTNFIAEAVTGLLATDMKGELRKGDTIGLWTYSDELSTDFPMQVWSEKRRNDIINEVHEHLRILVYENRSHLGKAWPAIQNVVANSERLTIILICDGSDDIKGTPFDKDINKLFRQHGREFRSAHEPFFTVMAARHGKIFDYTINRPNLVMIPHMADPLPPPEEEAPAVVVATPPPEITNAPPAKVIINLTGADFPHHTYSVPQVAANLATDSTPADTNAVAQPTPAPAPAPAPAAVTNAQPPVQPAPVAAQTALTAPAVNAIATPNEPASVSPPAAASPPLEPVVTAAAKPVEAAPAPPPTVTPSTVAPAAITPSTITSGAVVPTEVGPKPAASAVIAPTAMSMQVALMVIAFSLLTIAVALVVLLVWRGRNRSQPSLISQSLNRPH
ncbi:MAG TPA: VWA domain-containing protein [Verrucomicrobiae bacterium]|jgi:hypothetical protein|nr:VWA domain-containing protein [Verrucomicrobiae bacterium]